MNTSEKDREDARRMRALEDCDDIIIWPDFFMSTD